MIFKQAWVNDEDKYLVGNSIDLTLWVKIYKYKSLIVKERQQEHESNPSKFHDDEVLSHEDVVLHMMTYAWKKSDLLGLEDQKNILNDINKEMYFKSYQLVDVAQIKEFLSEGMKEESSKEELEDEVHDIPKDDIESVDYYSLQEVHDDMQVEEGYDALSYLLHNDIAIHDHYWSSFGIPLYDLSQDPSIVLEDMNAPHDEIISSD